MEPPKKYCFSDLGLRNARLSSRQQEPDRALGSVACDGLRRRGYGVDIGVVTCAEKDSDNKAIRKQPEADFVCNPASSRCYARSAYAPADEAKRRQDARPLLRTDDPLRKIVMTKDAVKPFHDDHGILTVSVCDFPLDPRPLESLP